MKRSLYTALAVGLILAGAAIAGLAQAASPTPPSLVDFTIFGAMAVAQSAYSTRITDYLVGAWATMNDWDADSRNCETAAGIGFGLACGQGASDKGAVLGGTLANFVGVSLRDITLVNDQVDEYQENDEMGIGTKGVVVVQTSVDTAPTDPVHYDATTGIFQIAGGSGPIVGARWVKSHASGKGILRLSGHLPVP